jgi:hypothetical protein
MTKVLFIVVAVSLAFGIAESFQVVCKSTMVISWDSESSYKTCIINNAIGIPGFSIWWPKDNNMNGLRIEPNKKVKHLPENLNEIFLNLVVYSAQNSKIQEISKVHFAELKYLKKLWLNNNQIQKVPGDSFEDLYSLEYLNLCESNQKPHKSIDNLHSS